MRHPSESVDLSSQAAGRAHWVCPEVMRSLEQAAKADNPASRLAILRGIRADWLFLDAVISNAVYACEREIRSDEEAPPSGAVARALYDGLAPRPNLRVVGK